MTNPKISIITVTFNSAKTLERTIRSIVEQGYSNLEYIIVDGGSTDGTLDLIRQYETQITRWISEPDDGISDAFNKGIRMASGEIIGIINSDDGLMPGALQALAESYEPEVDVYRGSLQLWKEDTGTKTVEEPSMHIRYDGRNRINHPSTFVTKKAYETYGGYDVNCRFVMDFDLLLRFQRAGAHFKKVDAVLAFFTLGGVTFTEFTAARRKEMDYILRKNGANTLQVWSFLGLKYAKLLFIRIFGKDAAMKLMRKR